MGGPQPVRSRTTTRTDETEPERMTTRQHEIGEEQLASAQPDTAVPEPPAPTPSAPGLSVARVLALQRSAGNHAVAALLASQRTPAPEPAMGGLVPGLSPEPEEGEDLVVGGVLARNGDSPTTGGGTGTASGSEIGRAHV